MVRFKNILAVAGLLASAGIANASVVNFTSMTADNHYSIYAVQNGQIVLIGGNEDGYFGNPGQYNWSLPEQYLPFNTDGVMYIAAWSDDSVSQGLLANVTIDGQDFSTGSSAWEVIPTNQNRNDDAPYPTPAEMSPFINAATAGNTWESAYEDGNNGVAPWGFIPGITPDARWVWWDSGLPDPLRPGTGSGEYLIFRIVIPAPGVAALLGLGGLTMIRRRRA
jgi:hypothetical protein